MHQLLGAFEFMAVVVALAATIKSLQIIVSKKEKEDQESFVRANRIACFAFLALGGHLIYTAFEGIPRYGFTAAPLLMILLFWLSASVISVISANQGRASQQMVINLVVPALLIALLSNFCRLQDDLDWLATPALAAVFLMVSYFGLAAWMMIALIKVGQECFKPIGERVMKTAAAISLCAFTLTITLSIIHEAKGADLVYKLSGPVLATRELRFSAAKTPNWALLLIDSSKDINQAHIDVNGHKLHETPKSIYNFYQKKFDLLAFLEELAADLKISPEVVRQWRAVPLPVEYLNLTGKNKISICSPGGKTITIYGDYASAQTAALPTFEYLSHSRVYVDATCLDWRPRIKFQTFCPSESSIESNEPKFPLSASLDLSAAPGVQKGQWRFLIAVGHENEGNQLTFKSESKSMPLSSLTFRDHANQEVKALAGTEGGLSFNTACRTDYQLNAHKEATHVIVELRGKARAEDGDHKQAIVAIVLEGANSVRRDDTKSGADLDSKGQPKPESIRFPNAVQMLALNHDKSSDFTIKTIYPLDAVRGRGDRLTVEVLPVPEGTRVKLEEAELSVREIAWPDLGRGTVEIY